MAAIFFLLKYSSTDSTADIVISYIGTNDCAHLSLGAIANAPSNASGANF
jgi:hypothetical protein